jgi:L-threonylcarbamoyladenylate synthase
MSYVYLSLADPAVGRHLQNGAVGVMPTDTVYGLVCSAGNKMAVKRLYDLKRREHKPGTIIASDIQQLIGLGIKPRYLKAVEHYWPAAISVVIPCGSELAYIHLGENSVPVRVSADKTLNMLINHVGPLVTTSANAPGKPTANTLKEAQAYFGNKVDFYVDGGDLSDRQPSTIIRIADDAIEVLREGAVEVG